MKKTIIMLLIACGISMAASSAEVNAPAKVPKNLKKALNDLCTKGGNEKAMSVKKDVDPNTGLLKEMYKGTSITVKAGDKLLQKVIEAFEKDKDCGYQYIHIAPGDKPNEVICTSGGQLVLREKPGDELWMLNTKNPDNPSLRDCYALVLDNGKDVRKGKIFIITSARPDIENDKEIKYNGYITYPGITPAAGVTKRSGKFVIEGTVDEAIADSCYNIYIADDDDVIADNDIVACVPVVNKKFRFETELDNIKSGRIRAIFPGNELCTAWIDIYFIPDFTVYMTVHNGHYNIQNQGEYSRIVNEYINRRNNTGGIVPVVKDKESDEEKMNKMRALIILYRNMISDIKVQIRDIRNGMPAGHDNKKTAQKRIDRLHQQMEDIMKKMQSLIDKFAESIDE